MDHTTYLQSLLDEGGLITLSHGFYEITRPLEICNNTHLLCSPNVTIRLADNANCPMLVNRCRGQEKPSRRIIIEGGVWDGNNIGQDRDKYVHPLAKVGQAFSFACTEDLCIKGLTIKDPNSYGIMLTDTRRFTVRDIRFDCNCLTLNQDGIHVNGYAYDGYITNITGNTNDDMIALNTDEGDFFSPCNDTENIVIDGVYVEHNGLVTD